MSGALVLAAHGSRRDPSANALVRRLVQTIRGRRLYDEVAAAFHQGEPGYDAVLDELDSDEVTVVPFLTSAGYYAEVVLPAALARNRRSSEVRLRQTPPLGTHGGIAPMVARRVAELLGEHGIDRRSVSLALVGHGTPRHDASRQAALQLADTLRRRRVAGEVLAAFLDDDPPLDALLQRAALPHVVVVPFLIGGSHVAEDVPRRLTQERENGRHLIVDQPVGTYPGLVEIIIDLARRHAPPPRPRFRPRGACAPRRKPGTVHLIGAGPGDPELITVRGLGLLRVADVVVHDRLVGAELLSQARADALLIDAGKGPGHAPYPQEQINTLLVEHAAGGATVVRLKGGDPFVFGRGSEEVEACTEAGIPVNVVPGVSSAIAAPAAAGIPVTARGVARSFTVLTGHNAGDSEPDYAASALSHSSASSTLPADTLVLLMGRANLASLAAQLIAAGRDPATPTACIQSATTPEQRVTRATLATIAAAADRDGLESPVVTVIGEVVRFAHDSGAPGPLASLSHFGPAGRVLVQPA
ncbi:MAG TPA: uroporphyrinogen-III C-methyltransferase [Gemmatimonadales bacterium]|nr:uroporphyrinogen-III C-methyltransferase [Gemmatimonadales bacterium]